MLRLLSSLLLFSSPVVAKEITLTPANSLFFIGEIEPAMMAQTMAILQKKVERNNNPIYLVLYSPGGQLDPLKLAVPFLQKMKNVNTITVMAASGAAAISQIAPGRRYAVKRAEILFHKVRIYPNRPFTIDDANQFIKNMTGLDSYFNKLCSARLKITPTEYVVKVTGDDWVLNANEAVKVGAIDEVITAVCDPVIQQAEILVPTYSPFMAVPTSTNICNLLN